jgi:hypothetical protein
MIAPRLPTPSSIDPSRQDGQFEASALRLAVRLGRPEEVAGAGDPDIPQGRVADGPGKCPVHLPRVGRGSQYNQLALAITKAALGPLQHAVGAGDSRRKQGDRVLQTGSLATRIGLARRPPR